MTTFRISTKGLQACVDIGSALFDSDHAMCLNFTPDGLKLVVVGIPPIAMVSAEIPLLAPPERTISEFFPVKQLKLAVEALGDLEELDVVWKGPDLTFKSGRRRRTIKSILPPEGVRPKIPDLPIDVHVEIPIAWLKRCIKGSKGIAYQCVEFSCDGSKLIWKNDSELGGYDDDTEVPEGTPAGGPWSYSKDYLTCISDMATGTSATLHFSQTPNVPLIADVPLAAGMAKFLLAPMTA